LRSHTRHLARAGVSLALAFSWTLAGCAQSSRPAAPAGHDSATPSSLAAISLPEVRADGSAAPFRFQPPSGHVLVVYFGYTTCPDVCPTTLAALHRALALIGEDARRVEVAFVTVDPDRDTPDLLAPYVSTFIAGGHALRPAGPAELERAEHAFGATSSVTRDAGGEIEVTHSGSGYLVNSEGRIVSEWEFGRTPELMAHDLQLLTRPGGTP
jgi:protein SCO1/2